MASVKWFCCLCVKTHSIQTIKRSVWRQDGPYGAYYVGSLSGPRLLVSPSIREPVDGLAAHANGSVGWVCNVYQRRVNSDLHHGRDNHALPTLAHREARLEEDQRALMEQSEAVAHQAAAVQAAKASAPATSTDATSPHAATILAASATAAMDAAVAAQERLSQELQAAEARTAVVAAALQAVVQELDVQVACCHQDLADLEDSRRQNIAAGGKAAEATSRAEAAETRLQNVRLQLKSMSGGKAMQRTLSGGLVSGNWIYLRTWSF